MLHIKLNSFIDSFKLLNWILVFFICMLLKPKFAFIFSAARVLSHLKWFFYVCCSVIIEELAKWKSVLCCRNDELQGCVRDLLDEMNTLHKTLSDTFK